MRGALVNLRGDAIIELLLVRITRFRYLTYDLWGRDIVGESGRGVKVSRCKVAADETQPFAPQAPASAAGGF